MRKSQSTKFVLAEDYLIEEEGEQTVYEYTFRFSGAIYPEEQFKQKLILLLKTLKSISTFSAIPEVADILTAGLKEGSHIRGYASFTLGDTMLLVRSKRLVKHDDDEEEETKEVSKDTEKDNPSSNDSDDKPEADSNTSDKN